jgi:hypothetical protein
MNDMRVLETLGSIALGIVAGKAGHVKVHRPTANLVPACLLFVVVALAAAPATVCFLVSTTCTSPGAS